MGRTPWANQLYEPTLPTSKVYGALDSSLHAIRTKSIVQPNAIQSDFFADFQKIHDPLPTWTSTQKQSYSPKPLSKDANQVAQEVASLNNACHVRAFVPLSTNKASMSTTFQRDFVTHPRDTLRTEETTTKSIKAIKSKSSLPFISDPSFKTTWKTHYQTMYDPKPISSFSKRTPFTSSSIHFGHDSIPWISVTKSHLPSYPPLHFTPSHRSFQPKKNSSSNFDLIQMESTEPTLPWTTTQKEDYQPVTSPLKPLDLSFQVNLNTSHTHLTCSHLPSFTPPTFQSNYQSHFVSPPSTTSRTSPFRPPAPFTFDQTKEPFSSTIRSTYLPPPATADTQTSPTSKALISSSTTPHLGSSFPISSTSSSSSNEAPVPSTPWTSVMKSDYTTFHSNPLTLDSTSPSFLNDTFPTLGSNFINEEKQTPSAPKSMKPKDVPDLLHIDSLSFPSSSTPPPDPLSTASLMLPIHSTRTQPTTLLKDANRSHFQLAYMHPKKNEFNIKEKEEEHAFELEKWKWHKPMLFQSKDTFVTTFQHVLGTDEHESMAH